VIADCAALGSDPAGLGWILGLAYTELEEGGCGMRDSQNIEDGGCVRAGSVVEREIDNSTALDRWLGA
jgi:hypothetical protein